MVGDSLECMNQFCDEVFMSMVWECLGTAQDSSSCPVG